MTCMLANVPVRKTREEETDQFGACSRLTLANGDRKEKGAVTHTVAISVRRMALGF